MSARATVLVVAVVAILGIGGLLLAAGSDERSTAFSLDIAPAGPVTVLQPGQTACQGPITATSSFGSVQPWINPAHTTGAIPTGPIAGAAVDVTVRDAVTNAILASGPVSAQYVRPISPIVALDRTIPSDRRIRVCLRSRGPGTVDLMGDPLYNQARREDDGNVTGEPRAAISLLFFRQHPRSLLSLVPTVFSRASLFRPGWVGPWTYWLLSAALMGAFVLTGVAVTRAARSDETSYPPPGDPVE